MHFRSWLCIFLIWIRKDINSRLEKAEKWLYLTFWPWNLTLKVKCRNGKQVFLRPWTMLIPSSMIANYTFLAYSSGLGGRLYRIFSQKMGINILGDWWPLVEVLHASYAYVTCRVGMLNSFFSCNWSLIVQNRILTEARTIPVDAHHAMSTESASQNRKRRLT